jgi:hypothetical protein
MIERGQQLNPGGPLYHEVGERTMTRVVRTVLVEINKKAGPARSGGKTQGSDHGQHRICLRAERKHLDGSLGPGGVHTENV